jgi:hypothetical protein
VKEIHVSGGSWFDVKGEKVRRDTHDNPAPDEVWESLQFALENCPSLEYIILEQLNKSLATEKAQVEFRNDFLKIRELVDAYGAESNGRIWGNASLPNRLPINDGALFQDQQELKRIFSSSLSTEEVQIRLEKLYPNREWEGKMVETGLLLADKWN